MHESELPMEIQMDPIMSRARHWAEFYHGAQLYGGYPYIRHLDAVVAVLWNNGYNTPTWIAAGFLHDILEDTPCTEAKLLKPGKFSNAIIELVVAVSGDPNVPRSDHCQIMYEKISKLKEAAVLKIADRVANLYALTDRLKDAGRDNDGRKYLNLSKNYMEEHVLFCAAVVKLAPPHMRTLYWDTFNIFEKQYIETKEGADLQVDRMADVVADEN